MIFSHSKDEAWSQHKHLHDLDNYKNTSVEFSCQGVLNVIVDELKGRNKEKTKVKPEWEKVIESHSVYILTLRSKIHESSLISYNNPRLPMLLVVAVHGSAL